MKNRIIPVLLTACILACSCNNETTRTGAVDDTTKVSPPTEKVQDTMSLTDTSHHIGDVAN